MTSALVATAGSASANTYATISEAVAYQGDRPQVDDAWTAADPEDRERALLFATKLMDAKIEWAGWPTTPETQALQWPRTGLYDRLGNYLATDTIPTDLKHATAELAAHLLREQESIDAGIEGVSSFEIGPLSMSFRGSAAEKVISRMATSLLPAGWFVSIRGQSLSVPLMRA